MSFTGKSPEQLARELKIANQAIEELTIFRSIVEGANDGISIVQEGLIKYVNQKLADLTGFTIDKAIGAPFKDFIHPSELPLVIERYTLRMAGKSVPPIYETLIKRQDGSPLKVEISTKVITYNGSPADLVIIRDLTERKRTEERLKISLAFMDAAPD
jgi:PAS domain S-box-containing protein